MIDTESEDMDEVEGARVPSAKKSSLPCARRRRPGRKDSRRGGPTPPSLSPLQPLPHLTPSLFSKPFHLLFANEPPPVSLSLMTVSTCDPLHIAAH